MENEKNANFDTNLEAIPMNVAEMVQYETGSVVSREFYDKKAGSITIFAFAEKQGLKEHTAPYDALVYILEGEVDISIAGNKQRLDPGKMILMPANIPHALKAVSAFKMMLIMIRE
jgi:quercetin dioxygenase-like cupin family protein